MLLASVLVKPVLAAPVLLMLELQALVLVAPLLPAKNNTNIASTSASRTGTGSTGAVTPVLLLPEFLALVLVAPLLLAMCYKHIHCEWFSVLWYK